jgi:putative transposase
MRFCQGLGRLVRREGLPHATRAIADWISFYNLKRPHQALGMKTPAQAYAYALAA